MARKVYSEEDREKVREALINTMIQCIVDRGLIHSSIDVLCKRVGISKTSGLCPSADGGSSTQLAGGRGDISEKLLLWGQKWRCHFVH